jgi:hypothetical protein
MSSAGKRSTWPTTSRLQIPKSKQASLTSGQRVSFNISLRHFVRKRTASLICPFRLSKPFRLASHLKPDAGSFFPWGFVRGSTGSPLCQTAQGLNLKRLRNVSGSNFAPETMNMQDILGTGYSTNSASANCFASNGWRSSGCSPRPMNLIGSPSSRWIATTIPPLLVPSSLVTTRPVSGTIL